MSLWDKARRYGGALVHSRTQERAFVAAIEIGRLGISAASSSRTRANGWMVGWLDGWLVGCMDGQVGEWVDGIRMAYNACVWTVRRFQQQREENAVCGDGDGSEGRRRSRGRTAEMHKIQMLFVIFISGAVTWTAV